VTAARPDTWMPLYIGDLLRDIPHLDAEKTGAYLLLIMAYWVSGRPLPDDDDHLSTVARVPLPRWRKVLRRIIAPFFQVVAGEWRHKRIDKELEKAQRISTERSKSGTNGAAKRWQTDSGAMAKPLANALQNDAPSQSQSQREESTNPDGLVVRAAGTDPPPHDELIAMVGAYNALAEQCGLPVVGKLAGARRVRARARLRESGMDGWRQALIKLGHNRWMHGHNDRGWRADFDFLLQAKSFTRLVEGGYDRDEKHQTNGAGAGVHDLSERRRPTAPPRPEDVAESGA
jgi:uncharacterized protein YdaU (DUF1376 family)